MRSLSDLFRNFLQLGYVTDDLDAAASYLESAVGTGKCVLSAVGLYRDAVRPGEPATLHHVGFAVDDFDEASAVVTASGRAWKQFGDNGRIRFGYLDMRAELGHSGPVSCSSPWTRTRCRSSTTSTRSRGSSRRSSSSTCATGG